MNQPALSGFDWEALDPDTRYIVRATTDRLHDLERRTGEAIVEIGRGLVDTKKRLGHGRFGLWIKAEFGWSDQTAINFMNVAERFGNNPKVLESAGPSALYALASGNVPEPIREEFIRRAEAGEVVRHKDVKERFAEEKRRLVTVDADTGEIMDEPEIEVVEVNPCDPASFLPDPTPLHRPAPVPAPVPSPGAQALSSGLIDAQAPATIARKLAECKSAILASKRLLEEFDPGRIVRYGSTPDSEASLDRIIDTATSVLTTANDFRDQIRSSQKVRSIR